MKLYSSIQALLACTIDYAGMFPPAKLSFKDSLKRAALWRHESAFSWLLNRIVLPALEFSQISNALLYESGADGSPWHFTVLASPIDPWDALEKDLAFISNFNANESEGALRKSAVSYEWKAPEGDLVTGFRQVLSKIPLSSIVPFTIFVETAINPSSLSQVAALTTLSETYPARFGLKVRTGGDNVPTPEELSLAIDTVVTKQLKFKATQGLHEAITHGTSFGFLNLFAALALKHRHSLDRKTIIELLKDENPKSFSFEDVEFKWKNQLLSIADIESSRKAQAASFGSCSLDEPQDSLKKFLGVKNEVSKCLL